MKIQNCGSSIPPKEWRNRNIKGGSSLRIKSSNESKSNKEYFSSVNPTDDTSSRACTLKKSNTAISLPSKYDQLNDDRKEKSCVEILSIENSVVSSNDKSLERVRFPSICTPMKDISNSLDLVSASISQKSPPISPVYGDNSTVTCVKSTL